MKYGHLKYSVAMVAIGLVMKLPTMCTRHTHTYCPIHKHNGSLLIPVISSRADMYTRKPPVKMCAPFASSFWLAVSRLPASMTTVVVPSPASMSWALESSTSYQEGEKVRGGEGMERGGDGKGRGGDREGMGRGGDGEGRGGEE